MIAAQLVALLLATATPAPERATIGSADDAYRLCQATAPLARIPLRPFERREFALNRQRILGSKYEAVLPLSQLDLVDLDEGTREVQLRRGDLLRPGAGVQLFVEEISVSLLVSPAPDGPGRVTLRDLASSLLERPGARVRLRYLLSDNDGAGPCLAPAKRGSLPVLRVEPLFWELLDQSGKVVASGTGKEAKDVRPPEGGSPAVAVAPATVEGEGPLAGAVTARARLQGSRLHACFDDALVQKPKLDGALVFQVSIDSAGRADDLAIAADSVNDEELASCARSVLRSVFWGQGGPALATIPVHFERD